jgi:hypothetical protein
MNNQSMAIKYFPQLNTELPQLQSQSKVSFNTSHAEKQEKARRPEKPWWRGCHHSHHLTCGVICLHLFWHGKIGLLFSAALFSSLTFSGWVKFTEVLNLILFKLKVVTHFVHVIALPFHFPVELRGWREREEGRSLSRTLRDEMKGVSMTKKHRLLLLPYFPISLECCLIPSQLKSHLFQAASPDPQSKCILNFLSLSFSICPFCALRSQRQ